MMSHKKSQSSRLWKLLALVPIVGVTLALNAETVTDYVYNNDEPQKQVPVKKGKKASTIKTGNGTVLQVVEQEKTVAKEVTAVEEKAPVKETPSGDVFDVVETMPQFPGGAPELFNYLAKNIRYPKDAMEANVQGRVIVTFVVGKDGSINDARVVKSVDPQLDAEALRVISSMPNWTPGTQSGKAVNVKYTVPISFRLEGGKPKEVTQVSGSSTAVEMDASNPKFKEVVSRLPGAKIDEDGNVTVNGKPVKKILVNGNYTDPSKIYAVRLPDDAASTMQKVNIVEVTNGLRAISDSGKNPLFILDGKKIDQKDLKDVDPQTIESISLLKDKAGISLYGEKAKDGVVVITTKK